MFSTKIGVCAALAACGMSFASSAAASPWNRQASSLFTISRTAYFAADGGDAADGTARSFEQVSAETYAEYGVSDRLMIGGKAIYAWQSVADTGFGDDALDGFAEAEAFGQYQLKRWNGGAIALLGTLAAPTSTTSNVSPDRRFERDARAGAAVLLGIGGERSFASLRAGPDLSLGGDAHTLKVEGTIGRRFGRKTVLLGEAFLTQSLGGGEAGGVDYSVLRAGPSVVLPFWGPLRMQIGGTVDVAGENVDLGASGFVGFWVGER